MYTLFVSIEYFDLFNICMSWINMGNLHVLHTFCYDIMVMNHNLSRVNVKERETKYKKMHYLIIKMDLECENI